MNIDKYKNAGLFVTLLLCISSCEQETFIKFDCENVTENWIITSTTYPTTFQQNDLFFINEETGYSVGHAGTIMQTSDGGFTWQIINDRNSIDKITELKLNKVFFVNEDYGFIGGERKDFGDDDELLKGAILIKTNDGGHTWNKKYFSNIKRFNDIIFFDYLNGIAHASINEDSINLTRRLLLTNDGGDHWNTINVPGVRITSFDLEFVHNTVFGLAQDDSYNSLLAISEDNGYNWHFKALPEVECNSIKFVNDQTGYLTCGNLFMPERVYKTVNQGETWDWVEDHPMNSFSRIHFVSGQQSIVINIITELIHSGGEGTEILDSFEVFETLDGDNSWSRRTIDAACGFDGPAYNLNSSVFFLMGEKFHTFKLK